MYEEWVDTATAHSAGVDIHRPNAFCVDALLSAIHVDVVLSSEK